MKKAFAVGVAVLLALAPGSAALADGRGGGGHHGGGHHGSWHGGGHGGNRHGSYWGVSLGGPGWWGAWPYPYAYGIGYPYPYAYGIGYPYPYAYGAYPVQRVIESRVYIPEPTPEVYVSREPAAPATSNYWFYCEDPAGYHPYVQHCNRTWLTVVPQTGGAPQLAR